MEYVVLSVKSLQVIVRLLGDVLGSWYRSKGAKGPWLRSLRLLWAYIRVRIGLAKYAALEYVCYIFLFFVGGFSVVGLLFYAVAFASMALAMYLNEFFSSAYLGYLMVSGLYLAGVLGVFFLFRSKFFRAWVWRRVERLVLGEDKTEG